MTKLAFLAAVLATASSLHAALAAQQPEDSVLVSYDLRAVLPRWDAGPSWSQSLLEPPIVSFLKEEYTLEGTLHYADLTAFELLDLLTQVLGDELRREGRELMVEGDKLSVLAPPGLHEQVRAVLDGLAAALAGTVPVRVDVLGLPEGGELVPAGTLGDAEAAKLVASLVGRGATHRSYSLELCAGRTAALDAFRRVPFLFDYDVEIAQTMMTFDPVMSALREGTRLVLRGRSASGGIALSMLLLRSEPLGKAIKDQELSLHGVVNQPEGKGVAVIPGPTSIQSPEVLTRGLALDTFLPEGKALVMTLEGRLGAGSAREIVVVRRLGGAMNNYVVRPIPRTNRTLIALDSELFRPGSLRTSAGGETDEEGAWQPMAVARFDGEFSGFLLEWLKARFSIWRRFGPWILIVTDPAWDRDAAAQLDRLVKSLRPATTLYSVGVDLRAQGREAEYPVRIRVPVLAGSSAGLVLARGETAVTGFDVEVAQGAAVPDPYVAPVFEGLALSLGLGDSSVEASGLAQLLDGPIAQLEPVLFGPIERPEPRVLRFDERFELADGRTGPLRIGSGSDRADQPGFALEITVAPMAR